MISAISEMISVLHLNKSSSMFLSLLWLLISAALLFPAEKTNIVAANIEDVKTKVYIIYMGESSKQNQNPGASHHQMLASVLGSEEAAKGSMIYSYRHGFSGFAAKMTESQAQHVAELPGVVKVFPNTLYKLQTTRSWDYLGLSPHSATNLLHGANQGDGTIIGVIDSGVWPESESFNDRGLGPIPARWKGCCVSGDSFDPAKHCNQKLIGARYFIDGFIADNGKPFNKTKTPEFLSPRDSDGHGTHCASTAGGSFVSNVSYKGLAHGTVRGGAPRARLAIYKVSWRISDSDFEASSADILKAIEAAIHDGVDVLSISSGSGIPVYPEISDEDVMYYGSFHAVANGITVVCSGGNSGPKSQTVENVAPWIISVAASTIDRSFPSLIMLGNNESFVGQSMYVGKDTGFVELIDTQKHCEEIQEHDTWLAGKVALCFYLGDDEDEIISARENVAKAGGLGMVVATEDGYPPLADYYNDENPYSFQCILFLVAYDIGTEILKYIEFTRQPMVRLKPTNTYIGKQDSTYVASFSSRGPNSLAPAVLKPDIAAPGIDILAAYVPKPIKVGLRGRYVFDSGTSMATPHIAGIVALLKCLHPTWSPAAMKSAIVTTAWTTDPYSEQSIFANGGRSSKEADPFDYGGGVVNPNKARNPGLVYDMGTQDYIGYLCTTGYSEADIDRFTGQAHSCRNLSIQSVLDLNFPSVTVPNLKNILTLTRTVTNVGNPNSKYRVIIKPPQGTAVKVRPTQLIFNQKIKKRSFKITISSLYNVTTEYYFGSLTWTDGVHYVKIPLSVKTEFP